ncbi:hypothetical protein QYE76_042557 [Lolium multiflorum]|uniref:GCK domain-containing protein n=1 Tax=Lolium multiflorum TaxID=4521 RepID=A0AAD8WV83_LOLMU|nr:hypothetical protein QYE76_042557 [Lolium multiflorum]
MASAASEIDPAAEPQVVVVVDDESSSARGSEEEAPPEDAKVETEADEGECEFCLYMKGGACKEAFVSWDDCVQAAQKEDADMVERCSEATVNLMRCMEANTDYYGILLRAEQHVPDQTQAAVAADADKNKVEESAPSPATDETKKEEAVVESAASGADAKEEVVGQAASSTADEESKKEEAAVEKVKSSSLGN